MVRRVFLRKEITKLCSLFANLFDSLNYEDDQARIHCLVRYHKICAALLLSGRTKGKSARVSARERVSLNVSVHLGIGVG
jgi:hypothetical protein